MVLTVAGSPTQPKPTGRGGGVHRGGGEHGAGTHGGVGRGGTHGGGGRIVAFLAAAALLFVSAGCSGEPATSVRHPSATTASGVQSGRVGAAGAPGCGDDQQGRYTSEIFEAAPVVTTPYTAELQADVYAPAADPATCRAGVVWVHGGGFTEGTRNGDAERAWGTAMARRGFVLVSIDYRLGTGAPFGLAAVTDAAAGTTVANAIADAQAAMQWLRDNGSRADAGGSDTSAGTSSGTATGANLRVDPGRVAIGGTSAGAMTALGAGLTAPDPPCAVVAVAGDLLPEWVAPTPPPVLFIHGNADELVPYSAAVAGVGILKEAGGQTRLMTIDGAGHDITGVPRPDMVEAAASWLAEHDATSCG